MAKIGWSCFRIALEEKLLMPFTCKITAKKESFKVKNLEKGVGNYCLVHLINHTYVLL